MWYEWNKTCHGRQKCYYRWLFHVPIPCKGLDKTQFDISRYRYYKIAYSRDKVLLAVRSDYNWELYSSNLASFRSPLLIIIPAERLLGLTAAGASVMHKTLPISGKNCWTVYEQFIQNGVRLKSKSTATVGLNLKTIGLRFNADSAVIISSVN